MKRMLRMLIAAVLLWGLLIPAGASAERRQTLMIYMCGSNLESAYGSASADINEMLGAGLSSRDVTVLVMTGGTSSWSQGYDASQTQISELGPRGMRVVWRSDAMNMGDPATLTHLLQFGMEKYPAQDYSLIMWDHGGGPLEGVCWDELHAMDHLSMEEMTGAIAAAGLEKKLAWIGFDACLMSSLEVACALEPYAQYMVASQETEPASGWNYGFIRDLATDADGAATGRRIVDWYFEGMEDSRDTLTLACMDLSRAQAVTDRMDEYFAELSGKIDATLFTAISGMRMNATGFGRAIRGTGDDGYDLVDLRDLTSRLGTVAGDPTGLLAALDDMIVYSRANISDAGGVSVYHPYVNKDKYLLQWGSGYEQLAFPEGYKNYVQRFGAMLTGEQLAVWEKLYPTVSAPDAEGVQEVTMQLTPEQAAETVSAELMILRATTYNKEPGSYMLTGAVPATLDENGVLHARAEWNTLYLVDSAGNRYGPLDYELLDEGKFMARTIRFSTARTVLLDGSTLAMYIIEENPETRQPEIVLTMVEDAATQSWSTRHSFDYSQYDWAMMISLLRQAPDNGGTGAYPPFWEWPTISGAYRAHFADVSDGWHFEFVREQLSNDNILAMFQITDTQQNIHCSEFRKLETPGRTPFTVETGPVTGEGVQATLSGYVSRSELDKGFWVDLTLKNISDAPVDCSVNTDVLLNGDMMMSWNVNAGVFFVTLAPGEENTVTVAISANDLFDIGEIRSLDMTVSVLDAQMKNRNLPLRFEISGCDVSDIAGTMEAMAEVEIDNVRWELLKIMDSDFSGVSMWFRITNNRDEKMDLGKTDIMINGLHAGSYSAVFDIPAGSSRIVSFRVYDDVFAMNQSNELEMASYLQESYGHDAIREITILQDMVYSHGEIGHIGTITLDTPWLLKRLQKSTMNLTSYNVLLDEEKRVPVEEQLPLAENQLYSVRLDKIITAHDKAYADGLWSFDEYFMSARIYACLHITNHSDESLFLKLSDVEVNGETGWDISSTYMTLAPHQTEVCVVTFERREDVDIAGDPPLRTLEWSVTEYDKQIEPTRIGITLRKPAGWEEEFGTFILPDGMTSTCTGVETIELNTQDAWEGPVSPFMEQITVPENAAQYITRLDPPLSQEQMDRVTGGVAALLQYDAQDDCYTLISYSYPWRDKDGSIFFKVSGLALSMDGTDVFLAMEETDCNESSLALSMKGYTVMYWQNHDFPGMAMISKMQAQLDYAANQAVWTVVDEEYQLPPEQSMYYGISSYAVAVFASEFEKDPLPHYSAMERGINIIEHEMSGKPVQLVLRPCEQVENLYVLFNFDDEDGTSYALPMIPYSEFLQGE